MSKMLPGLQNDPTVEWLSFRSDNDAVVFAPIPGVRFGPVQLEAGEFQCIEGDEQVLRPLETVATFPDAPVHEKVIENWRAEHVVLFSELADGGVSAICVYCDKRASGALRHRWSRHEKEEICLLPISA